MTSDLKSGQAGRAEMEKSHNARARRLTTEHITGGRAPRQREVTGCWLAMELRSGPPSGAEVDSP